MVGIGSIRRVVFARKVEDRFSCHGKQVAKCHGGRNKLLERLGSAHTDTELTVLPEIAPARLHPGQGGLDLPTEWGQPMGQSMVSGSPVLCLRRSSAAGTPIWDSTGWPTRHHASWS